MESWCEPGVKTWALWLWEAACSIDCGLCPHSGSLFYYEKRCNIVPTFSSCGGNQKRPENGPWH